MIHFMLPLSKQQEFFVPEADVTSDSDDADSDDDQSNSNDSSCIDSSAAEDEAQDVQEDSDVNEDEVTSSQRSRHSMSCDHIEEDNVVVNRKPNKN